MTAAVRSSCVGRPLGSPFVYYCRTYMKAVRGGGVKRGDVCYGMLRAATTHALHLLLQVSEKQAHPPIETGTTMPLIIFRT